MAVESQPWNLPEDTVELIDKEPGVINNALIRESMLETKDGTLGTAIDFDKIKELRLEFYDILRIDHLNMCTQLTKLSLSNNVIKEIHNLNKLVNLITLNLSFNRITKIKGLEALEKLEELSLFNNEISIVENLDSQKTSLRLLSLGCNKIHSSSCLIYLRRLKKLSSLNLEGNPFVHANHLAEIIGGILPSVDYYNYRMIRPEIRQLGKIKLRSLLTKLEELDALGNLRNKMSCFVKNILLYLEKAFISGFNDDAFYGKMLSRDLEGQRLDGISDKISTVFERLKEGLKEASKNIVKFGVDFYSQRKLEIQKYKEEYTNNMLIITHQSTVVIRDFMTSKSTLLKSIVSLYSKEGVSEETAELRMKQAIVCDKEFTMKRRKAWWDLMEQEMLRLDKDEEKLVDLGKTFAEQVQVEFLSMRNTEEEFFISLSDQVNQYLVEIHMNNGSTGIAEHFKAVLLNKEKRERIIGQSHKNHLSEIEMAEEKLLNQVKEWQTSLIKAFCIAEIERNRKAIIEINQFISHHKKDWAFQTQKALSNAYSYMKSIDPYWTHEVSRIKMNSKERMLDDQMEAMFRDRFQATTMRKRMEVQVKEEQGQGTASNEQADLEKEEKRELEIRAKRKAYRFAYSALLRRNTQLESIYQTWNSAEDLSHCTDNDVDAVDSKEAGNWSN